MLRMCVLTVFSETDSSLPISSKGRPRLSSALRIHVCP